MRGRAGVRILNVATPAVPVLMDMAQCGLGEANRKRTLQRYKRAVERRLEQGDMVPLKLSEYLAQTRARYAARDQFRGAA
jgi:hypothetical protein